MINETRMSVSQKGVAQAWGTKAEGAMKVPSDAKEVKNLLSGLNVRVGEAGHGFETTPTTPQTFDALMDVVMSNYETSMTIAKNLGVSEAEKKTDAERREAIKERLLELIDEMEDEKAEDAIERNKEATERSRLNCAINIVLNALVDPSDRSLVEARAAEENPIKG